VRGEINGELGELLFAANRTIAVLKLLMLARDVETNDEEGMGLSTHGRAGRWILSEIAQRVSQRASRFNVRIDSSSPVAINHQIVLQLPEILNEEHKDEFSQILEDIATSYRASLAQSFVKADRTLQERPTVEFTDQTVRQDAERISKGFARQAGTALGGLASLGVAAAGVRKYLQDTRAKREAEQAKQRKSKTIRHKRKRKK